MKLIFIDEQYGNGKRGKFTAVTAAIFSEEIINDYRREFVSELALILNVGENTVQNLPVIHGTGLLEGEEYTDEQRIAVSDLLCNLIHKHEVEIIRVGYYDKSLIKMGDHMKEAPARLGLAIFSLELQFKGYFTDNYIFLYELDKQNLEKTQYNDKNSADIYGQLPNPDSNMTIDYKKSLGRFYCSKENYCMYASDLTGWLLYQAEKQNLSDFKKKIIKPLKRIPKNVRYNEIIWMNVQSGN